MSEPYRPRQTWLMDWNGDGGYDHPASDVTEDVASYRVRFGSAADTPQVAQVTADSPDVTIVGGILSDTAQGSLTLYDRNGRFDPDNAGRAVDRDTLRAPVSVRLLYDGAVGWEGRAIPQYGATLRSTQFFDWELTGTYGENIKARLDIFEEPGSLAQIEDPDGIPLDLSLRQTDDLPLGLVTFNGARIKYYEAVSRLAGGWMLEDNRGNWILRTLLDAQASTPRPQITAEYGRYEADAVLRGLEPLVRTRARLANQTWARARDQDGNIREVPVGNASYDLPASGILRTTWSMRPDDTRRIDTWLDPVATGGTISQVSFVGRSVSFTLVSSAGGNVLVSFRANVSEVAEGPYRDVIYDSSEAAYGKRDLGLEPWLNSRLDGGEKVIVPWLQTLTEPLVYGRATYPEWQDDPQRSATLTNVVPGRIIDMVLPDQQGTERFAPKVLVLAVRLEGGANRIPTRTIYGIVTSVQFVEDLVDVSAFAFSPFEVQVEVRVSDADPSRTMYVNVEKA